MNDRYADQVRSTDAAHPRRGALALLCGVNFMVIMDAQIVILALPAIKTALSASETGVQWVLSIYLLCFGGLLLLGGRAGDLLGCRRMLTVGIALFGASSLACGAAETQVMLIVARAVQGISAALMAPTALSALTTTWPRGRARTRALAAWGGVGGLGATAALLIGGGLTSTLGWRWIFWVNVPIAVVMLALAPLLLTEGRNEHAPRSFDLLGAVTLTVGLATIIYALVSAPARGWGSAATIVALAAGVAALAGFVATERRMSNPLLDLSLLRSPGVVRGNGLVLTTGASAWGLGIVTSTYAQDVLGYSPMVFGLGTAAMTLMAVAGARIGQQLLPRYGGWVSVGAATCQLAGCLCLLNLPSDGSYWTNLFPGLLLFGLGLGTAFMSGSVIALAAIHQSHSGIASGIITASFQLGGALGSALVATALVSATAPLTAGMLICTTFAVASTLIAVRSAHHRNQPGHSQAR